MMIQDWLTIIFRVLGILIAMFGVLPKAYREAKINDGINLLRKLIFAGILIYVGSSIGLLVISVERIFLNTSHFVPTISLANGFETTIVSLILYIMYSKKCGDEQK